MDDGNGLTTMIEELGEMAAEMPDDLPPRLLTAGLLSVLKETRQSKAETGRRLRRVEKGLLYTIGGLVLLAVVFLATHADVPWLGALIGKILGI